MFCANCGGQMNDNAAFCPYCGYERKVNNAIKENAAHSDYNHTNSDFCVRCGRVVPQGYSLCPQCMESERRSNSSKSGVIAIIISSAAVMLLIICVLLIFILKPFDSGNHIDNESEKITDSAEYEESTLKKVSSSYEVYYTYYPVTWEEANQIAKNKGGYLACIDSREEFNALCDLAESYNLVAFWIGGKRESGAGWNTAKYVNGEALTYVKWLPGEPTYYYDGIEETYLMVLRRDDEWYFNDNANDLSMDYPGENYRGRISFIIEKDVY